MIAWFRLFYFVLTALALILYLPKLIGFRYAFKKPKHYEATDKRRIALVVPARGESKIIGDLFASIQRQDYDPSCFDVFVIVKEKTDPTVNIALKMGARVFVVEKQKCKGDALDGFFKALTPETLRSYESFVIVDADAVLDPAFVRELNCALETDFDIFIARKYAKNFLGGKENRSIFSNCSALTWPMIDDLGNTYRMEHAIPLNLCGQGMMIRRRVIEELGGWPYRTLTEDYELKLDSLLRGFKSMFCPFAILYTEEALEHSENFTRRLRWLTGYKQCDKKYRDKIKKQARERGKYTAGEFEYFFGLFPPVLFAVTTAVTMVAGISFIIYYLLSNDILWRTALTGLVALPFFILYILLFAYGLLAMFACREMFKPLGFAERLAMLLYNPFYMLEYFPIYIKSWWRVKRNKTSSWKPTERIHYDDLKK